MQCTRFMVLIELFMTATIVSAATAFSTLPASLAPKAHQRSDGPASSRSAQLSSPMWRSLRGGDQQEVVTTDTISKGAPVKGSPMDKLGAAFILPLATFSRIYSQQLESRPIMTKSATSGVIFALSDYLAQRIERSPNDKNSRLDWTRLVASGLVGLLYFGPAAHYWYEMIFRLLPGTTLASTMAKAFWGQIIFGPSFTCIFFAVGLLQSGSFTLGNWWSKIRSELPGAWLAGAGFWPIVDLISFSVVPIKWIPLFINMCSLVWTIYLSLLSNRSSNKQAKTTN